jgi:DNA-binding NarL/FixJ family response regulator
MARKQEREGRAMTDTAATIHQRAEPSVSVLVVEDEALVALYLEDTLDALGYACCGIAASADEAIGIAASQLPDLALVDVGLRGSRDGIAVAADLVELGVTVVFMTGASDNDTRRRAEAVRPRAILNKPCKESDIARALELARASLAPR